MREGPGPSFGFVGWNPFQMLRFVELARATPGSVLIVEKRAALDAPFWQRFIAESDVPVLVWDSDHMAKLDGVFDVIVCQTPFAQLGRFERSKIAMLQYGLAKEPHNHGPWRALADLCLVYGPYTARKMSYFCPVAAVGDPHMDRWNTPALRELAQLHHGARLDPERKTVLYVPTWGALSTQDEFAERVTALAADYNVLIKLHHNTDLLEGHRAGRTPQARVHYLGADSDLLELLCLSDVVLSDYSGAIFDALFCEKPVVLLQNRSQLRFGNKLDAESLEYAARDRIGPVVESPAALSGVVKRVLSGELSFAADNRLLVDELYVRGPGATARASAALHALANDELPARSQQQAYVREEMRRSFLHRTGSTPKTRLERELVEGWLQQGEYARVLRYAELRAHFLPKLYVFRAGLRAAHLLGEHERRAKLMSAARKRFPMGQLEPEAQPENGDTQQAQLRSVAAPVQKSLRDKAKQLARVAAEHAPPQLAFTPIGLAYALSRKGRRNEAVALLESLPDSAPVARALLLASLHRKVGDDLAALRELMVAQLQHPGAAPLLTGLANALCDNGELARAHAFLQLSARQKAVPGKARLFYFQSEMGWFREGERTLDELLALPIKSLAALLPNFDRATVHYPELRDEVARARESVREYTRSRLNQGPWAQELALRAAIDNRWASEIQAGLAATRRSPATALIGTQRRAQKVLTGLGPLRSWLDLAWRNEQDGALSALSDRGRVERSLETNGKSAARTVELFIPTPFFAHQGDEKATYETVREAYRQIAASLLTRDDVWIVPRMQLNWRHAAPRTHGRVLSYHTHGPRTALHWHLQEAPLAGHVSIDHEGFAGFASIARDFSAIDAATAGLTSATLEARQRELHERYVVHNLSKYPQAKEPVQLTGRYVFMPTQIMTDVVNELADLDVLRLLEGLVEAYAGSDVRVVVKRHPYCHSTRVQRTLARLAAAGRITMSNGSVHALIAGSEAVYTVNSGVGVEALMHLKPVVVAGACDYLYAAQRVRTVEELRDVARTGPALDQARALRFLHFYSTQFLLEARNTAEITARVGAWLNESTDGESVSGLRA